MVASVHSKLRMPAEAMTPRMIAAIGNPHTDVLGHCTGRLVDRPGPAAVGVRRRGGVRRLRATTASRSRSTAAPSGQDPPDDAAALAVEAGCVFAIDTDAHAPGQLDWLDGGCVRAERFGLGPDRVINTRAAAALTEPAR